METIKTEPTNKYGRTKKQQNEWNQDHSHDFRVVKIRKRRKARMALQKESRRRNR